MAVSLSPCRAISTTIKIKQGSDCQNRSGMQVGCSVQQLQLPLPQVRRPRHSSVKIETQPSGNPVVMAPGKPTNPPSCSQVTDILHLMDSLRLPVPLDLYVSLIKECTDLKDEIQGMCLHQHIQRRQPAVGVGVANRLLLMYVSYGRLATARKLFDEMPERTSMSWTILIVAYAESSDQDEASRLFHKMLVSEPRTSSLIITRLLETCTDKQGFKFGQQIHGRALKLGHGGKDASLVASLINFYTRFGSWRCAQSVFSHLYTPSAAIWKAMIVGYCSGGKFEDALEAFKGMIRAGKRNYFVLSCVLRACAKSGDREPEGRQLHAEVIKTGVESEPSVQSSLVFMYGNHSLLGEARKAFELAGSKQHKFSWFALLNCYVKHQHYDKAIKLLYEMEANGIKPPESLLNEIRISCGS